jgi:hypothetical protein
VRLEPRHVLAQEHDAAGGAGELAAHQVEERRLSRAVRSDNRVPLPGANREIHTIHGLQAAEDP